MPNEKKMGLLLPFAQSAQSLRRFATKRRAQGNDLKAVELLRLSMRKDENDEETALALAEAYAAIQCYSLSNRLLMPLIGSESAGEDSLFGVGCNMLSMGMETCARDCFVIYLQNHMDGAHVQEAVEMLDCCEEGDGGLSPAQKRVEERVQRALASLDEERPMLAVRLLHRALAVGKKDSGAHALLAFALMAAPDPKGALSAAKKAFSLNPRDLRAKCAMALSLFMNGAKNTGRVFLEKAADAVTGEDEAMLVCHTACEMDAPLVVLRVLKDTEAGAPYADELLHLLACAYHNSGDRDEAVRRWKLLRRIDPLDAVAEYRLRKAEAGLLPEKIPYTRQLPLEQTLENLTRLRLLVQEGAEALQGCLDGDDELEALLAWAVSCDEEGVAQTAVGILMALSGKKAERLLRSVLSDAAAGSLLKHEALAALCIMGAQGPFYMVVDGRMALVRVSRERDKSARARDRLLYAAMLKRTGAEGEKEKNTLRALCGLAEGLPGDGFRMKAVALAYALLWERKPLSAPTARNGRRILRAARRMAREVAENGMR